MSSNKQEKRKNHYNMYINGKICTSNKVRTINTKNNDVKIMEQATSDDLSKAVSAARAAYQTWKTTTPAARGALLYKLAEAVEARADSFKRELIQVGVAEDHAKKEVRGAVERIFWYAGWCDKLTQIYSTVNPVMTPYVSVTTAESTGVVAVFAPPVCPLLGVVSSVMPVLVAGNATVVLTHPKASPDALLPFMDALNAVSLPPGLINILNGDQSVLAAKVGGHAGIDAIAIHTKDEDLIKTIRDEACKSLKHMEIYDDTDHEDLHSNKAQSPYRILPFVEFKTTWHPCAPMQKGGATY